MTTPSGNSEFNPFILQGNTPLGLNDSVSSLFHDLLGNMLDGNNFTPSSFLNSNQQQHLSQQQPVTQQQAHQVQQQQSVVEVDSSEFDDFNFDAPDEGLINPNLHSIACLNCRKLHRKCDKKYPSCSECLERGKECCYRTPKKKGRTKGSKNKPKPSQPLPQEKVKKTLVSSSSSSSSSSSDSSENNLSPPSHSGAPVEGTTTARTTSLATVRKAAQPYVLSNQQLLNEMLKRRTIDMYYDIIGMGCGVVPKPKMERLAFEYLNDDDPNGDDHFYDSSSYRLSSTKCSIRALLFSMQALCEQRKGFSESANAAYREAKRNLANSFDDLDNPYIKLTYGNLSSYLAGEGDDITANFYLNNLKYALEKPADKAFKRDIGTASDLSEDDDEKMIKAFMMKCSLCSKYDNVDNLNIWDSFNTLYSIKTQKQPPYSLESILRNGITPSDVPKLMSLTELIKSILENYAVHSRFSTVQSTLSFLMKEIIYLSSKITILLSVGIYEGELLESLADQITLITEHDMFGMLPCSLTHFVIIPLSVHIKIFPKIERMIIERLDNGRNLLSILEEPYLKRYFENIAKDLRAMQMLKLRYKRIDKYYSRVIADLEKINKWKLEKQFDLIESFEFGKSPGNSDQTKKNEHFPFKSAFQSTFITTHPFDPKLRYESRTPEQEQQGLPQQKSQRPQKDVEPVGSSPVDSTATFRANHQPIQSSDLFDVSNDELFPFEMETVNTDIFANIDEF